MKSRRSLGDCILSNSFRRLHQSGHSCGLCCFLLPLLQYLWENFSNISGISAKPDFVNPDFWDLTIAKFWQFMGTKMLLCDHWPTSRTRVIKLSWTLTFTTTTKKNGSGCLSQCQGWNFQKKTFAAKMCPQLSGYHAGGRLSLKRPDKSFPEHNMSSTNFLTAFNFRRNLFLLEIQPSVKPNGNSEACNSKNI